MPFNGFSDGITNIVIFDLRHTDNRSDFRFRVFYRTLEGIQGNRISDSQVSPFDGHGLYKFPSADLFYLISCEITIFRVVVAKLIRPAIGLGALVRGTVRYN
jgi:hypothetical protein